VLENTAEEGGGVERQVVQGQRSQNLSLIFGPVPPLCPPG